jgi:hypothetical protein
MVGADAAFVVAEDHVHDPVQAIFDRPWLRMIGPSRVANSTRDVMWKRVSCSIFPAWGLLMQAVRRHTD